MPCISCKKYHKNIGDGEPISTWVNGGMMTCLGLIHWDGLVIDCRDGIVKCDDYLYFTILDLMKLKKVKYEHP